MAKYNLDVGQVVYVEYTDYWTIPNEEREITPATVVDVNKSSAYVMTHSSMERNPDWKEKKYLRNRVSLKDLSGKTTFDHFQVWLSVEDFKESVEHQKMKKEIEKKAKQKFERLRFSELKRFLEEF